MRHFVANILRSITTTIDGFDPVRELDWERSMYRSAVKGMNRYCVRVEAYVRICERRLIEMGRVAKMFDRANLRDLRQAGHRWNADIDFDDPKGTYRLGDDMMKNLGL